MQEGDGCRSSRRGSTKTDDLIAINGLQDAKVIYIGQELKVPGAAPVADTARPAGAQVSDTSGGKTHGGPGETISGIAAKYGGPERLVRERFDDPDMSVGQVLKIP